MTFLPDENDAQLLKNVTKDDVLGLFLSHVHPSSKTRSKLAVHMHSLKARPKKISPAAAEAFEALVRKSALAVGKEVWKESRGADGTPALSDYTQYWKEIFGTKEDGERLLNIIPSLVGKHPLDGEDGDQVRPGVTYIEDIKAFKAGLKVSVDPGPMVQWGDLPVSKF